MNCLSLNICGTRTFLKRSWVKLLCLKNRVTFLGLQETRMMRVDLFCIKAMWGNSNFDFASSSARCLSGGILSVWDPNVFSKKRVVCSNNAVIVEGVWVASGFTCFMGERLPASGCS